MLRAQFCTRKEPEKVTTVEIIHGWNGAFLEMQGASLVRIASIGGLRADVSGIENETSPDLDSSVVAHLEVRVQLRDVERPTQGSLRTPQIRITHGRPSPKYRYVNPKEGI